VLFASPCPAICPTPGVADHWRILPGYRCLVTVPLVQALRSCPLQPRRGRQVIGVILPVTFSAIIDLRFRRRCIYTLALLSSRALSFHLLFCTGVSYLCFISAVHRRPQSFFFYTLSPCSSCGFRFFTPASVGCRRASLALCFPSRFLFGVSIFLPSKQGSAASLLASVRPTGSRFFPPHF